MPMRVARTREESAIRQFIIVMVIPAMQREVIMIPAQSHIEYHSYDCGSMCMIGTEMDMGVTALGFMNAEGIAILPVEEDGSITGYRLSCSITEGQVTGYGMNCGKTEETIESYELTCTKTPEDIDYYEKTCGREEGEEIYIPDPPKENTGDNGNSSGQDGDGDGNGGSDGNDGNGGGEEAPKGAAADTGSFGRTGCEAFSVCCAGCCRSNRRSSGEKEGKACRVKALADTRACPCAAVAISNPAGAAKDRRRRERGTSYGSGTAGGCRR